MCCVYQRCYFPNRCSIRGIEFYKSCRRVIYWIFLYCVPSFLFLIDQLDIFSLSCSILSSPVKAAEHPHSCIAFTSESLRIRLWFIYFGSLPKWLHPFIACPFSSPLCSFFFFLQAVVPLGSFITHSLVYDMVLLSPHEPNRVNAIIYIVFTTV